MKYDASPVKNSLRILYPLLPVSLDRNQLLDLGADNALLQHISQPALASSHVLLNKHDLIACIVPECTAIRFLGIYLLFLSSLV